MHTTNYHNAFIEVAEDCPVTEAEVPPRKAEKTIANIQYDMLIGNPYRYTSDDVIFEAYKQKSQISDEKVPTERAHFFSRGQACLRSSPLAKRYGWGIHHDPAGKIAIYPVDSKQYGTLANDSTLKHLRAMRSTRGPKAP